MQGHSIHFYTLLNWAPESIRYIKRSWCFRNRILIEVLEFPEDFLLPPPICKGNHLGSAFPSSGCPLGLGGEGRTVSCGSWCHWKQRGCANPGRWEPWENKTSLTNQPKGGKKMLWNKLLVVQTLWEGCCVVLSWAVTPWDLLYGPECAQGSCLLPCATPFVRAQLKPAESRSLPQDTARCLEQQHCNMWYQPTLVQVVCEPLLPRLRD